MKNPIKRFKDIFKKEEVIETINISHCLALTTTISQVQTLMNKFINKKISFNDSEGNKTIIVAKQFYFTIKKDDIYNIQFSDDNLFYGIVSDQDIQIWGKRTITKEDPYGEEDWTE